MAAISRRAPEPISTIVRTSSIWSAQGLGLSSGVWPGLAPAGDWAFLSAQGLGLSLGVWPGLAPAGDCPFLPAQESQQRRRAAQLDAVELASRLYHSYRRCAQTATASQMKNRPNHFGDCTEMLGQRVGLCDAPLSCVYSQRPAKRLMQQGLFQRIQRRDFALVKGFEGLGLLRHCFNPLKDASLFLNWRKMHNQFA